MTIKYGDQPEPKKGKTAAEKPDKADKAKEALQDTIKKVRK